MYHEIKKKPLYGGYYYYDCHRYDYLVDFYHKTGGINSSVFLTIFNPKTDEWITVSAHKLSQIKHKQIPQKDRSKDPCPVYLLDPEIFTPLNDVLSGNFLTVPEMHLKTTEGDLI